MRDVVLRDLAAQDALDRLLADYHVEVGVDNNWTVAEMWSSNWQTPSAAAAVDALDRAAWGELGVAPDGEVRGAPGYSPRLLLGV